MKEKKLNALIDFAIVDALGVPVEFLRRESVRRCNVEQMLGYGAHKVPEVIWHDDTSLTHAHAIRCVGCKIYSDFVQLIINGNSKGMALEKKVYNHFFPLKAIAPYNRILNGSIKDDLESDIKSSGCVVDSLEAAIWANMMTSAYDEAVLKAINLGNDTDTIGAIICSINGLIYDKDTILEKWLLKLRETNYLEEFFDNFAKTLNELAMNR